MSLDLPKALAEWQEALRLQDWDIKAEILPKYEFEAKKIVEDELARNVINTHHKTSEITISEEAADKETRLVHELSHLLVNGWARAMDSLINLLNDNSFVVETMYREKEKAVCAITRALLKVRDMAQEAMAAEPERPEITE